MNEYTPTTEQVRDGYRYDPVAEYHDPITPHHIYGGQAFDRWLAEHDREVAAKAWDEGAAAGWDASGEGWNDEYCGPFAQMVILHGDAMPHNPYKKEPTA